MQKTVQSAILVITIISSVFILSSCDPQIEYFIQVDNQSSRDLMVTLETWTEFNGEAIIDTIPSGQNRLLHSFFEWGTLENPRLLSNFIDSISIVSLTDSLTTKRDFLQNENWVYDLGLYEAQITNADFE